MPSIRIQSPDGTSQDDIVKALRRAADKLESKHDHSKVVDRLSKVNPAAKHMISFIDESYRTMIKSMSKEILKVLEPK